MNAMTCSCSRPLLARALPPLGPGVPSRLVNRPPASSTTIETAAMSCSIELGLGGDVHAALGDEHVGPEVADGPGAPAAPGEDEEVLETADALPGRDRGVREVRVLERRHVRDVAAARGVRATCRSRRRCPFAAHHRRPRAGADTTPATTSSSTISPIRVAQIGTPRMKLLVPSIGSITQRRGPQPVTPDSSPSTASRGRARPRVLRSTSSTRWSASDTGVRSGFVTTCRSSALNRSMVNESASSARMCASRRSSVWSEDIPLRLAAAAPASGEGRAVEPCAPSVVFTGLRSGQRPSLLSAQEYS